MKQLILPIVAAQEEDAFAMYKKRMSKAYTYRNAVLNSGPQNNFMPRAACFEVEGPSLSRAPYVLNPNPNLKPPPDPSPHFRAPCVLNPNPNRNPDPDPDPNPHFAGALRTSS